jgi:hypothetical protein
MTKFKFKVSNNNSVWDAKRRYKLNSIVGYDGEIYQNITGINSVPTDGVDWLVQGNTNIIELDLSTAQYLANNSQLKKDSRYKITGCSASLYGGTTLLLRSLDLNKFAKDGIGIFYTPKYLDTRGSGIWTSYVEYQAFVIEGTFDENELVIADNGATGYLFPNIKSGFIIPVSGDWYAAVSITGDVTGATSEISDITVPLNYSIGDKTIWGGYVWQNLTGDLGSSVDDFTLDAVNWVKIPYNNTDYNVHYDKIKYDYEHDLIIEREDSLGNEISFNYRNYLWFEDNIGDLNAIKYFQFGLFFSNFNGEGSSGGVFGNKVQGGFANLINCRSRVSLTTFKENSYLHNVTLGYNSSITNSSLEYGANIRYTTLGIGAYIENITLSIEASIGNCTFDANSVLKDTNFEQRAFLAYVTLGKEVQISYSTLKQGAYVNSSEFEDGTGGLAYVTMEGGSRIELTTFKPSAYFTRLTLGKGSLISSCVIPLEKAIENLIIEPNVEINAVDLSTATIIYNTYPRTVYERPDGALKIRYYNNSDVLVITDIID